MLQGRLLNCRSSDLSCYLFKAYGYTFRGSTLLFSFLSPFSIWVNSKRKNFLLKEQILPVRVDTIIERLRISGKQTGRYKCCSLFKMARKHSSIHTYLNMTKLYLRVTSIVSVYGHDLLDARRTLGENKLVFPQDGQSFVHPAGHGHTLRRSE